eukprot:COSAG01_NODE_3833_length_5644_cov_7.948838_4_plen_309_part_00
MLPQQQALEQHKTTLSEAQAAVGAERNQEANDRLTAQEELDTPWYEVAWGTGGASVTSSTTEPGPPVRARSCSVVLTEQEKRFWAALQKDEPLRNVTSDIGTGLGPWAEAEKSELVRVIYKVSGPHPSGCSKFTAVVLNSVVLNSPLLGMNVPTQVCRTCSDYNVTPTMVMLAHLHATRNRNRIDAFLRNTGAPAGSKGGKRLNFVDWCFQNHHDLPASFMKILPTRRKQNKVRKKVTGAAKKAKTGEAVTAVVGGVAAAAGLQKVLSLLDETRRQKPMFEKQIEAIQNQVGALEKQIAGSEPEHEVV